MPPIHSLMAFRRTLSFGVGFLIFVLANLFGYFTWLDYGRTLREANSILLAQARALSENAEATLRAANAVLVSVERVIDERGGLAKLDEKALFDIFTEQLQLFSAKNMHDIPMHAFFAVGADGIVHASSLGYPTKKVSTLDREYYRHFSQNPDATPLLSEMSISRLSGLPVVFLTTGLKDRNGRFAGVLGISLRIQYLDELNKQWQLKEGQTITLHRQDGKPVYRFPMIESFLKSDFSSNPTFGSMLATKLGNEQVISPIDGVDRTLGYVVTDQYPLVAIVSTPTDLIIAAWRQSVLVSASIFALLAAALLVLARLSLRQAETVVRVENERAAQLLIANRELSQARDAAEAANRAKTAFLTNMSHEMRTPLHHIAGMARLIHREPLSQKQGGLLNKLEAACDNLTALINTVLELTKIEADTLTLKEKPVAIRELLANVEAVLHDKAAAKALVLTSRVSDLPHELLGDPYQIRAALLHYAENAVRFTDAGSVTIHVTPVEENADGVLLRFAVEDTGIGIAPEALPRLFSIFEQADNSPTRKYGGTGLGLFMTKKLAQLMGGDAGCESRLGGGSTFWFTARLKKQAAPAS